MHLRAFPLVAALAVCLPACGTDETNPFDRFSFSQPPSEGAVMLFVSGAWAEETGAPRELYAINADGTEVERLTSCAQRSDPCDFLQVAPSSVRERVAAVRGSVAGDPEATALFFIDLGRSVETIIAPARRVQAADWAISDAFLAYSTGVVEDIFTIPPNGTENDISPLTQSPERRERYPRIDFQVSNAVFEGLDETPGKSRIFSLLGGEDGGPLALTQGGPGTEVLPGTPYIVGSDSTPAFSTSRTLLAFRRLTGTGNGGLGTWDILTIRIGSDEEPVVIAGGGGVYRGAPDWSLGGEIAFVETDADAGESRLVVVQPDGSGRRVIHVEDAGYRMASPRWLR